MNLDRETIRKAKVLAARQGTSISRLLGAHIEAMVDADDAYELAKRHALALLERGFHLGGKPISRSSMHER